MRFKVKSFDVLKNKQEDLVSHDKQKGANKKATNGRLFMVIS